MRKCRVRQVLAVAFGAALIFSTPVCAQSDSPAETTVPASIETNSEMNTAATDSEEAVQWNDNWIIPNGISIAGISLSDLSVAEARVQVNERINTLLNREISVDANGKQSTSSAKDMGVKWANPQVFDEAMGHMARGNFIIRYKNQIDLKKNPVAFEIQLSVPPETVHAYAQSIADITAVTPIEPTVKRQDGKFQVIEGSTGLQVDLGDLENQLMTQLADPNHLDALTLQAKIITIQPNTDKEIFTHFSEKPLGSCTTQFATETRDQNRCFNIELSAGNMNGNVILPGEEVSTLKMYGDVTEKEGYKMAGTYMDGQVVDGIGGGICQTTTTLYNAVLLSELEVVYRRSHSMLVDYVKPGMDATVDYGSGSDFKFKNNTSYPIYIESYRKDNTVTVTIYGTESRPQNRRIEYESRILEWSYPETPENPVFRCEVDPKLAIGWASVEKKQYTSIGCHPKVEAELYKHVYVDGKLEETVQIGDLNKYRYSGGKLYYAADCKVKILDPSPGSKEQRNLYIECTFLDGVPVGPEPPAKWSKARLAEHEAAMKKLMKP